MKKVAGIRVPSDVVEEILARLPAKSLLRFNCVDKSWYSLIRNPSFVSKHLLHQHDHVLLLLGSQFLGYRVSLGSRDSNLGNLNNIAECRITECRILGHCDGLICFIDLKKPAYALHLWNPAIRQHKILPQSDNLQWHTRTRRWWGGEEDNLGFGYDPKSRDYKVVRFATYLRKSDSHSHDDYHDMEAEVYSLSTDSWRPVSISMNIWNPYSSTGTYLDGFCYWMGSSHTGQLCSMIISYDMSNEVFRQIYLPDQVHRPVYMSWRLFVWKGSLALVIFPLPLEDKKVGWIDIWLLEDHDFDLDLNSTLKIKEHWILDLDSSTGVFHNIAFSNVELLWKDEMIFYSPYSGLKAYHTTRKQIRDIHFRGVYMPSSTVVGYTRSLVSLHV